MKKVNAFWSQWTVVLGLLLIVPQAQANFKECAGHFPNQKPQLKAQQVPQAMMPRELCFTEFAILHSGFTKTPIYVVERLSKASLAQAQKIERVDRFYEEARLPSAHRAQLEDYKNPGWSNKQRFDRGHLAPAANMSTEQGMAQSFSLANMVPQYPEHNRKLWSKIEADVRKFVFRQQGNVFVWTGPLFTKNPLNTIGSSKVAVPDVMFKVVWVEQTQKGYAYLMPHNVEIDRVLPPISLESFTQQTGLKFWP